MTAFKDISGKRFGMLTTICRAGKDKHNNVLWRCDCDCGGHSMVRTRDLKNGNSKSCGCAKTRSVVLRSTKHGYSRHPLYKVWANMCSRCENPKSSFYNRYGGRGVSVCSAWRSNPKVFIDWALCHGWEKGLQIDRVDNNGSYTPENCRIASVQTNLHNKSIYKNNNSIHRYRGVYTGKSGKYEAVMHFNKKRFHLGSFVSPVSAAIARDIAVMCVLPLSPLNFPCLNGGVE